MADQQRGNEASPPGEPRAIPQEEKAQDRFSRRTSNATWAIAFLTIALVFVGILQYCTFRGQLVAMRGQLNEMQADQRPWVSLDPNNGISFRKELVFDTEKGATASILGVLRNTGKSPAFHVVWKSRIFLQYSTTTPISPTLSKLSFDRFDEIESILCDPLRNSTTNFPDLVIFPNDSIPRNTDDTLTKGEIDIAIKNNSVRLRGSADQNVQPAIVTCIDYQTLDGKHHQTRYRFYLVTPDADSFIFKIKPTGAYPNMRFIAAGQTAD